MGLLPCLDMINLIIFCLLTKRTTKSGVSALRSVDLCNLIPIPAFARAPLAPPQTTNQTSPSTDPKRSPPSKLPCANTRL
jgi:hypothetical protein